MLASLVTAAVSIAVLSDTPGPVEKAKRPNVILIMTDDQGIGDFSIMGNPVLQTPNLDKLATGGVRMTHFYVSPVCTPTRACLMTGRYNYRTRALDTYVGRAMMEPAEVTVAEVLRDAGYATGIFGKWHLGDNYPTRACLMTGRYNYRTRAIDTYVGRAMMDPAEITVAEVLRDAGYATGIFGKWHLGDNYPMRAIDQGFAESLVIRGGGIGQPSDPPGGEGKYTDPILFHNGRQVQAQGYCTDVFFNAAVEWIDKNCRQGQSFFAYIATNAPHEPLHDVPEQLYEQYKKKDLCPVLVGKYSAGQLEKELDRLARIFAMLANIDENVGNLMRKLKALDILDTTMVVFLTDNGPNTRRYVDKLRGMKTEVHQGGIRTAFFVHWPGHLRAGTACDVPAAHIDVIPTILEACGVTKPEAVKFDGRSILPLLEGRDVNWPDRTIFIQSHRGDVPVLYHHFAAISQPWKLLNPSGFGQETFAGPPKFELYDLATDPGEQHNLAQQRPELVDRLKRAYEAWFKDVGATRPDNYAPPRIYIGTPHENPVVLTRQNWRRGPAARAHYGLSGLWLLYVAKETKYDIRLRFPAGQSAGTVEMNIQDVHSTASVAADATECTFKGVPLKSGNAELQATLTFGDKTSGPWQVDISGP